MAAAELEVVRRVFAAFERRDPAELTACFHEDGVFQPVTAQLVAGGKPYVGHEGLRQYLEDVARVWEELRPEPVVFHEPGDGVVVATGRVYAWGVGRVVDAPVAWLFRFRGDRVAYARIYDSVRQALADGGVGASS